MAQPCPALNAALDVVRQCVSWNIDIVNNPTGDTPTSKGRSSAVATLNSANPNSSHALESTRKESSFLLLFHLLCNLYTHVITSRSYVKIGPITFNVASPPPNERFVSSSNMVNAGSGGPSMGSKGRSLLSENGKFIICYLEKKGFSSYPCQNPYK